MDIDNLLKDARKIWGDEKPTLNEIIVLLSVVIGDISRQARNQQEGRPIDDQELQKELGNILFSVIRWCDDLGYDPKACIELAKQSQTDYRQNKTINTREL